MTEIKFDQEELDLLASYEAEEWTAAKKAAEETARYRAYARASFRKDKRVNIRISERDLVSLQKRALHEGIPYQTLIASVLHKYASGALAEK
jgi:predicted DNA binding CopG/RHH family protein